MSCSAFEKNLCALDCTLELTSDPDHQYDMNKSPAAVFLDIKKAHYDVLSLVVVRRLEEQGATARVYTFIRDFFYSRSIRTRLGES